MLGIVGMSADGRIVCGAYHSLCAGLQGPPVRCQQIICIPLWTHYERSLHTGDVALCHLAAVCSRWLPRSFLTAWVVHTITQVEIIPVRRAHCICAALSQSCCQHVACRCSTSVQGSAPQRSLSCAVITRVAQGRRVTQRVAT